MHIPARTGIADCLQFAKAVAMLQKRRAFHPAHSARRRFLQQGSTAAALFTVPGLFAEELLTPAMTEGPFYPDKLPLDTDNDLLILNDSITPAVGEITHLTGRIVSASGRR